MRAILGIGLAALLVACGGDDSSSDGGAGQGTQAGVAGAAGGLPQGGQGGAAAGAAGQAGAAGAAAENQPPSWEAPAEIEVREGQSFLLDFKASDPDGDPISFTISGQDGWLSSVTSEPGGGLPGQIEVLGLHGGADTSTMVIDLDDQRGGTAQYQIKVRVTRKAWGDAQPLAPQGIEAREHPSLIFDEARQRVLVLGGSGYKPYGTPLGDLHAVSLVDGAVTKLTGQGDVPPPGGSRRVAAVPGKSEAYLFGGYGETDSNDLWRVDFSADEPVFTLVKQDKPPSGRGLHLFARDASSGAFFVFGGVSQLGSISKDLFKGELVDGVVTWKKIAIAGDRPSGRYGFFYSYDQDTRRALVYSGAQALNPLKPARDLWSLDTLADPPVWTLLLEGDAVPEGRRNGAFAYDDAHDTLYVWGGTPDAQNTAPGLWAYDAREGVGQWFEISREGAPPIRSSSAGFVDGEGKLWMGFGNTTKAIYSDLTPLGF